MKSPKDTKNQSASWREGSPCALVDDIYSESIGERETLRITAWARLCRETHWLRPKTVCVLGGAAGRGKSLFLLESLLYLHDQGVPWLLLPLEDTAADVYRRVLAFLTRSWSVMETNKAGADARQEAIENHIEMLSELEGRVMENPRLPVGEEGNRIVPPLPYSEVLSWIDSAVHRARVVAVDPLAQIDWTGSKPWESQADFMRRVVGMAADSASTVILIAHSIKRPGKAASVDLSAEDIQGASELTRLAHTVLLWEGHPDKVSPVWRPGGSRDEVEHNRTMIIGKARHGRGQGMSLAFSTREDGPGYDELGVIAPKTKEGT